jgi:hypothetical protein
MAHLYLTTDAFEAETLIEDTPAEGEPQHKYYDIDIKHGNELAGRVGFNPMCSVELNPNTSDRAMEIIAGELVKHGLLVATESNGTIRTYSPADLEFRERLVQLAVQKPLSWAGIEDGSFNLMLYSNGPNQIREFKHGLGRREIRW